MENKEIKIDDKAIERLKKNIILKEGKNLKTRELNDSKMVSWIKHKIEEEVKCCSNQ